MRIGLTYDLRDDYRAPATARRRPPSSTRTDTIEAIEEALRRPRPSRPSASATSASSPSRLAGGDALGSRVQHLPRGCTAARARPRCRRCSTPTTSPTPSPTRWYGADPAQGDDQARGARPRPRRPRPSPWSTTPRPTAQGSTCRYPLFAKPVAEGTGKGVDAALAGSTTVGELRGRARRAAAHASASRCWSRPICRGREFTVGIIGTGAEARSRSRRWRWCCRPRPSPASIPTSTRSNARTWSDYRLADDAEARARRRRWRSPPGGRSAAATPAAWTCAPTQHGPAAVPGGQSAGRPASGAFRPADPAPAWPACPTTSLIGAHRRRRLRARTACSSVEPRRAAMQPAAERCGSVGRSSTARCSTPRRPTRQDTLVQVAAGRRGAAAAWATQSRSRRRRPRSRPARRASPRAARPSSSISSRPSTARAG